jgi:Dehydrogenases with different specificities (related to short-chain alcohol dehydrogenases)
LSICEICGRKNFIHLNIFNMSKLNGKVAIITGATSGMGLDTAKLFLKEGAKVVITGRSEEKLNALESQLSGDFLLVRADASSLSDSKALIEKTVATFGKIDILFLNAGIFKAIPIGSLSEADFDEIYNINVKGPLFTVNEAVQQMNDGGTIIFNTSVSNVKGMPGVSIYGSSKASLRSITRTLAAELAPRNIRVNAVSPGPIETPIWSKTNLTEEEISGFAEGVSGQVPLGRFGKGEEVAKTALFLASSDASYITGSEIPVDGGMAQV